MMKKTLVALAVIAVSGTAIAQSSVTLYGMANAGIGRDKWSGSDKTKFLGGTSNVNLTASRVGLTGVEDLGSGNKAGFQFETGLSLEDGRFASGGSSTATPWGRQANVWIGGNWGTIKLGRQFTVSHIVEGVYDLTGLANYSVNALTFKEASIGHRAPSAIAYISPNMGGLTAAVAFVSKNNIDGATKNIWDAGVMYSNGPLGAGLSVNKGLDSGKTNYQLGAKYGFGNFTVAAGYHQGSETPSDDLKRRGFNLGVQAKFGAFTVTLDATRDQKREAGKKYTNAVLEGRYALSKRTNLYADVLRFDGKTGWGLGIHHRF